MIFVGADPGLDGALAFLDVETLGLLGIVDMPTAKKANGRREILLAELVADVVGVLDGRRVGRLIVERQQPFAGAERSMGATSAFALGECYMAVKMLAASSGWPMEIVTPAAWKRAYGLPAAKEAALGEANRQMPIDAGLWRQKRGVCTKVQAIARAEAALIALHGARTFAGIARSPLPVPLADLVRDLANDVLDEMIDAEAER